jgi:hypothetical protein
MHEQLVAVGGACLSTLDLCLQYVRLELMRQCNRLIWGGACLSTLELVSGQCAMSISNNCMNAIGCRYGRDVFVVYT